MPFIGLISGRLRNKRYCQTEIVIFEAFLRMKQAGTNITPGALAKEAGISRITLCRHHCSINKIKEDYLVLLLQKYRYAMRAPKKSLSFGQLLYRLLLFIAKYRKMCKFLIKDYDISLIKGMLSYIKTNLVSEYTIFAMSPAIFDMYVGETYAVILAWSRQDFAETKIEKVHHELIFLAKTMPKRSIKVFGND